MFIKASNVTNLTDARYFAAKEVAYLGFTLEEGADGYLDPMYMKAIREWIAGPLIVGEFFRMPIEHVAEAAAFYGLDAVQVAASSHLGGLATLVGMEVVLHVDGNLERPVLEHIFREAAPLVSCFLLDFSKNQDWESTLYTDTDFWNELFELRPTLLQANLAAAHLPKLMKTFNLSGLSLVGGEEERVGVKSFDEIEEIFEVLEHA